MIASLQMDVHFALRFGPVFVAFSAFLVFCYNKYCILCSPYMRWLMMGREAVEGESLFENRMFLFLACYSAKSLTICKMVPRSFEEQTVCLPL